MKAAVAALRHAERFAARRAELMESWYQLDPTVATRAMYLFGQVCQRAGYPTDDFTKSSLDAFELSISMAVRVSRLEAIAAKNAEQSQ